MVMRCICCWMFLATVLSCPASDIPPVIVDYFYEPGCPNCAKVRDLVLPELEDRFAGFYRLDRYDVSVKTNVVRLIAYQEALNITSNESVMMVLDYRHVLNGFDAIEGALFEWLDRAVAERLEPGRQPPEPFALPPSAPHGIEMAQKRVRAFTLAAVLIAGLTDGINPCAIATLVFFMSLLATTVGKRDSTEGRKGSKGGRGAGEEMINARRPGNAERGKGLLLMGIPFCLASFVTYTALGFGLLRALHLLSGFERVRDGLELVLTAVLVVLAVVSFGDAWKYCRTGNAATVVLQLPAGLKTRIHGIIRKGMKARSLVLGGLVIGALVTALESVCTGQVYVPTLALVATSGTDDGRALSLLLLYNAMFIVPLVTVFILTWLGLRTETLVEWSRRNVVVSKVLLGLFFVAMAALMLAL